ncbi:MAG TPA: SAM-dependent methyltransferase [Cryomorphaceae bacterium]|nr:SAM-dependent methyltransferase [Cryomorphaceae bacterium]|tara:strand:+ start:1169 stop:1906 length:738 start_codon:yes stop_codon:yes gene_type:complete
MTAPWYATWFNTEFYHDLYRHRDEYEARRFIVELCKKLGVNNGERAMDMACGRGRHAKVLSEQGLNTLGLDLSPENISFARQFQNECLEFKVGNMLEELDFGFFDWVMNLFTSFGYFDDDALHQRALNHMAQCLKPGGRLVLDYMNSAKIAAQLVPENLVHTDKAVYRISRKIENGIIVKSIKVSHDSTLNFFEERVRAFSKNDLYRMLICADLENIQVKGNYDLSSYKELDSERMIFIAQKPLS